jgi:hypothetical protein
LQLSLPRGLRLAGIKKAPKAESVKIHSEGSHVTQCSNVVQQNPVNSITNVQGLNEQGVRAVLGELLDDKLGSMAADAENARVEAVRVAAIWEERHLQEAQAHQRTASERGRVEGTGSATYAGTAGAEGRSTGD